MEYFIIRESLDAKIIGRKYPQVKEVIIPTTCDDNLFIQSFQEKKAPENVLLPKALLWKSAKLTDLLSAGMIGLNKNLLISKKLAYILQESNLSGFQFFETTVLTQSGLATQYTIVHPCDFYFKIIDYSQSEIGYYLFSSFDKEPKKKLNVNSEEEMIAEVQKFEESIANGTHDFNNLLIKKVRFLKNSNIDFFSLRCVYGGLGFYVSERLKEVIEKAGCTGIVFTEPNERYP
jgi:hypothetical protein